jgi:hypothetical protein
MKDDDSVTEPNEPSPESQTDESESNDDDDGTTGEPIVPEGPNP